MAARGGVTVTSLASKALGAVFAGVLALMVLRTEDATPRPDCLELIGAVL
jgi:hypothetical protein